MPKDSTDPRAWFARAEEDLAAARLLLPEDGLARVTGEHIQQAIEKALKGFLYAHGRTPPRIHDLEALLDDVLELRPDLSEYVLLCEAATTFYTWNRYPGEPPHALDDEDLSQLFEQAEALLADLSAPG